MLTSNRIINNPSAEHKIGPIRTADLGQAVNSKSPDRPEINSNDWLESVAGYRGILIHENNFDILNPFI
jgi:hypothetical protein